jgi:hypothetical protein
VCEVTSHNFLEHGISTSKHEGSMRFKKILLGKSESQEITRREENLYGKRRKIFTCIFLDSKGVLSVEA